MEHMLVPCPDAYDDKIVSLSTFLHYNIENKENILMLVIVYPKNRLCGGLGDRIVGLIAVKIIADKLNVPFYIDWQKEDVSSYLNYEKYNFRLLNLPKREVALYDCIDKQTLFKNQWCQLKDGENPFGDDITFFFCN